MPASYTHPDADSPMRPEVGTQASFRKKKAPKTYKYDSSLSPSLDWDGQNPAREQGEALIRRIVDAETLDEAKAAATELGRLGKPFLDWAGKAERLSFDVPTLPLFVHERLSTKAILETLTGHQRNQQVELDLFADPNHSITDQVLRAYEHREGVQSRRRTLCPRRRPSSGPGTGFFRLTVQAGRRFTWLARRWQSLDQTEDLGDLAIGAEAARIGPSNEIRLYRFAVYLTSHISHPIPERTVLTVAANQR